MDKDYRMREGKPEAKNSRSCRCITEHRESHNHSMCMTMGDKVHWWSHKHIDVHTKDMINKLRENNVKLSGLSQPNSQSILGHRSWLCS